MSSAKCMPRDKKTSSQFLFSNFISYTNPNKMRTTKLHEEKMNSRGEITRISLVAVNTIAVINVLAALTLTS
jgi:hypothetical protein